jgi:hypothetical protein
MLAIRHIHSIRVCNILVHGTDDCSLRKVVQLTASSLVLYMIHDCPSMQTAGRSIYRTSVLGIHYTCVVRVQTVWIKWLFSEIFKLNGKKAAHIDGQPLMTKCVKYEQARRAKVSRFHARTKAAFHTIWAPRQRRSARRLSGKCKSTVGGKVSKAADREKVCRRLASYARPVPRRTRSQLSLHGTYSAENYPAWVRNRRTVLLYIVYHAATWAFVHQDSAKTSNVRSSIVSQ